MKIKAFIYSIALSFSLSTLALADELENSIKNISNSLASINQDINNAYHEQNESIVVTTNIQPIKNTMSFTIPVEYFLSKKVKKITKQETETIIR